MVLSAIISIIVPCYNCEKTIVETIESIQAQTYTTFEVIIVDDGSSDNSIDRLSKLQDSYDNIRVISQKNSGVSVARNRGISEAIGQYITFLDSDDLFSEKKLETQLTIIESHNVDAVFSGLERFEEKLNKKNIFNATFPPEFSETKYLLNIMEMDLFSYANFSTGLFKKEVFESITWNSKRKTGEDWELWLDFSAKGFKAHNLEIITNYYRKHECNTTKGYNTLMTLESHLSILDALKVDTTKLKPVSSKKVQYYAKLLDENGTKIKTFFFFLKIFWRYPHSLSFSSLKEVMKAILLKS